MSAPDLQSNQGPSPDAATGAQPVSTKHRFDETSLLRYLDQSLPGFAGPMRVWQFAGGQSNPTFLLDAASGKYVLRKKPPGKLLPSAHAIDREYRVLRVLKDAGLAVPRVHLYCDDASIIGTPFYVMEYVAGRIFTDPALPTLSREERRAAYDSMNAALASLHRVDWRAELADFGRPERYAQRQIERWSKQYQTTKTEVVPAMDEVQTWLLANVPPEGPTSIAHGDYRIGNLLYDANRPSVAAILDWELSTIGHPYADLAFNCMCYYFPPGDSIASGLAGLDLKALGIPSEDEYLEAYALRTGNDPRPQWRFFMAFSLYRTAAIQQGVYARALAGNASSTLAERFGDLYRTTAATAWDVARGR
ncbi:MAG TPA: phosphotransferase [Steroidobacter sp.]|uniref:phosphotransferase n=1 Tax=Steroidobacter sp. TaxID=1978227 RepID=UPI002ED89F8E